MNKNSRIFIAGHNGMVGSSVLRKLNNLNYKNILIESRVNLNLEDRTSVFNYFKNNKPEYVFMCAAFVGGINANQTLVSEFLFKNIDIQNNIILASKEYNIKRLIFLGSSCIYPRNSKQPIKESYLLTDTLEETNKYYAIAKISGIFACDAMRQQYGNDFFSVMPTNLYGPNDNYDLKNSHVIPALILKCLNAKKDNLKEIELWGDGLPLREFLHVDDLAEALILLMNKGSRHNILNIGSGKEIKIIDLLLLILDILKYDAKIKLLSEFPNGTPRKLLDSSLIRSIGWEPKISLREGLRKVIDEVSKK